MLYSIGYSTRSLPEFLHELHSRGISQLVDVRSSPQSRNAPFNRGAIQQWAEREGILYRQSGDTLGGRADIALHDPAYIAALDKLTSAGQRGPLAIMCSEGDPSHCHRTWEIGASILVRHGVSLRSILRNGREEDVTDTLKRVRVSALEVPVQEIVRRALAQDFPET